MAPLGGRERRRARRQQRRARREQRRGGGQRTGPAPPGASDGRERYRMTQRLVSIGDDYTVETATGEPAFVVDGKVLRVRETLQMTDLRTGDEYGIQERLARVRDTMAIEKNGQKIATVHKALVTPLRDRFSISTGTGDLHVIGNILDHEYRIERDGATVGVVSKNWFRVRDTYGIEVATTEDAGLIVACSVVLDMMVRPDR